VLAVATLRVAAFGKSFFGRSFEGDDFILRASEFQSCDSAPAVLDKAIALFEVLNGAMRAAKGLHPVRYCGVYELLPEGWRQSSHGFPPAAATDLRVRINVDPAVPAPPPTRSNVQAWVELSERSDHLTDALIYAGRGEWFDIYKAIECLEAFAGGGESDLKRKRWVESEDLTLMKRGRQAFR
jgi:hypothetical protein